MDELASRRRVEESKYLRAFYCNNERRSHCVCWMSGHPHRSLVMIRILILAVLTASVAIATATAGGPVIEQQILMDGADTV